MKIIRYQKCIVEYKFETLFSAGFKEEETLKDLHYALGWNFANSEPWISKNRVSRIREKIEAALELARKTGCSVIETQEAKHFIFN